MKIISILTLVVIILTGYYLVNIQDTSKTKNEQFKSGLTTEVKKDIKPNEQKKPNNDTKVVFSKDNKHQERLELLKPLSKSELEHKWEEAYGCYIQGAEKVDDDVLLSTECANSLLTASSFEEAVWMQRQGYPDKYQLDLLNYPENVSKIKQMADKKYVPAINLMAVHSFQNEHYKNAMSWALRASAYADPTDTFPFRMHGEAMIKGGFFELGLAELKVADYLGDSDAGSLFLQLTSDSSIKASSAIENANLIMARRFNAPFNQYPSDPRPVGGGG
ncbi:MAG: hypothetical protein DWP95_12065 [Proteobacteria bacterium]|nr:MAG: hypothetical protein DWP95_12065 [Pseudomonadota bacterium]